jgi:hypothetical protein
MEGSCQAGWIHGKGEGQGCGWRIDVVGVRPRDDIWDAFRVGQVGYEDSMDLSGRSRLKNNSHPLSSDPIADDFHLEGRTVRVHLHRTNLEPTKESDSRVEPGICVFERNEGYYFFA